jgi:polysaccharide biosynthesis/export protein
MRLYIYPFLLLLFFANSCVLFSTGEEAAKENQRLKELRLKREREAQIRERQLSKELLKLQEAKPMTYTIDSGDKFDLTVYNNADLNMKQIVVKPDGTLTINLIGEVKAAGLTVEEATLLIEEKFKKYIKYPKVTLNVFELIADSFTIVGQVGSPGVYSFDRRILLSDACAMARGFTIGEFHGKSIELASLTTSYVIRDKHKLPVNFLKAIREGNALNDIPIRDGDYIYIASVVNQEIFILGEVRSQVYLGYQDGLTLARALVYAKGRPETASDTVLIIRQGKIKPNTIEVDVGPILRGEVNDFPLLPNDLIYVQRSDAENWNRILRKIQPTLDTIQSLLELKNSVFPIHGEFIPADGWWGIDKADTININPL